MGTTLRDLLPVLAELSGDRSDDVPLTEVARRAAMSPHHAQRTFRRLVGESPKQYQLRLRLEVSAVRLLTTDDRVAEVARAAGFADHETFSRAFARRYGASPTAYRNTTSEDGSSRKTKRNAVDGNEAGSDRNPFDLAIHTGPCIGLYRFPVSISRPSTTKLGETMSYQIELTTLDETPILFTRRRIDVAEVATQLAEMLPDVFAYVMEAGLAMAGPPVVRYAEQSPAFVTLEAGIPLAEPAPAPVDRPHIEAGALPAGNVAVSVHTGPYDTLHEAHAAIDRWLAANDHQPGGAPWEVYLTDPGEVPDPADWKTQVIWPLA